MFNKIGFFFIFIFFTSLNLHQILSNPGDDKVITDNNFKFTFKLPEEWDSKDIKETKDKDGISYSFERKDKKMTIMLLAFKLSSVKNIDDFIYNMEKDISLNIPPKYGDYSEQDFGKYDMKSATYKDDRFEESIYYFRTKLPDASNNFVYMLRFITEAKDYNSSAESLIKLIASGFTATAE